MSFAKKRKTEAAARKQTAHSRRPVGRVSRQNVLAAIKVAHTMTPRADPMPNRYGSVGEGAAPVHQRVSPTSTAAPPTIATLLFPLTLERTP